MAKLEPRISTLRIGLPHHGHAENSVMKTGLVFMVVIGVRVVVGMIDSGHDLGHVPHIGRAGEMRLARRN